MPRAAVRCRRHAVPATPVTGGAGRDAALRIAGKYQALRRVAFPKAAPGLGNTVSAQCRQPARLGGKISGNVGRVLSGKRLRQRPHDSPQALAGAIVVELFEHRGCIHSGESRDQARRAHARFAMAGRTIQCDERAMLRVAGSNLVERAAGPGDLRRRAQGRFWLRCRSPVGGDAEAAADCPQISSAWSFC